MPTQIENPFEREAKLKAQFAAAWLRLPTAPFDAACEVYGDDISSALYAANFWVKDPEVLRIKSELEQNRNIEEELLSKEETALQVLSIATSAKEEAKDKIKAFKLYCEIMGFIVKVDKSDAEKNGTELLNKLKKLGESLSG